MSKIGLVGYGHIGKAVKTAHSGYPVVINDPKYPESVPLTDFKNLDVIYVCVPSPSNKDGSCDISILAQVLKDLYFTNLTQETVIISHTTAPPGAYRDLQELYPNLVHVPEFVTERHAELDYQNARWAVYGGHEAWAEKARDLNRQVRNLGYQNCILVDIETAALYKYFSNSFLATKVTIATEWKKLADILGVDWDRIQYIATLDKRISHSHLMSPGHDGKPGWAGACFPKDISAIIAEASNQNIDFKLLKFVENLNREHRQ